MSGHLERLRDRIVDRVGLGSFGESSERGADRGVVRRVVVHRDATKHRDVRRKGGERIEDPRPIFDEREARTGIEVLVGHPVRDVHDEKPRRPSRGAAAASRDMRSASGAATPSDSAFMNVRRRSARELVINTTF